MQRNKYLDDLGLKITEYGTNFISDDDERSDEWKKQRDIYGFDSRECWNLDTKLIEWLYSHLMMYLEDASEIVDLTYYKFGHNGKIFTEKDAIEYILERLKKYLIMDNLEISFEEEKKCLDDVQDSFVLLSKILFTLWW